MGFGRRTTDTTHEPSREVRPSEERDYEFSWWVRLVPTSGSNFWMPLRINPEQEDLWHDLVSSIRKAGTDTENSMGNHIRHVGKVYPVEDRGGR